jgi:uncharacterized heparinase superfamily protein
MESLFCSNPLFRRMSLSEKSATFRDRAFADRLKAVRVAGQHEAKRLRRTALRPLGALLGLVRRPPERLLCAPRDLRTADPTVAVDVYAGWFTLAGKVVNSHGRSPFEIEGPSEAWSEALAGFAWLRHLRAADTALSRANARVLVDDWIALNPKPDGSPAWRPEPTARRLMSWLAQAPLILQNADLPFHRRFMRALGRHAVALERLLLEVADGEPRLLALIALAEFGLCAAGADALRNKATEQLEREIARQILPDGGHISRNPQALVDLLLDLTPLRQIWIAKGSKAPTNLFNAVDRMGPMLRLFRHGDGDLALFNGMGATPVDDLAAVLSFDDVRALPIVNAPASGYQRVEAGSCVMLVDVAKPPPGVFSRSAHAGALAFEFSSGAQRLVVNCGAPSSVRPDLRQATRATAAHSTLTVANTSSCRFALHAGLERWRPGEIVSGPNLVQVRRSEDAQAIQIEAFHDGYDRRFNLVHRRRLRLWKSGRRLEGRDSLEQRRPTPAPDERLEYAVRFHLHPNAETRPGDDPGDVGILLPHGETWLFRSEAPATIEESVFFASPHGARPSRQIVLHLRLGETRAVDWLLARVQGPTGDDLPA